MKTGHLQIIDKIEQSHSHCYKYDVNRGTIIVAFGKSDDLRISLGSLFLYSEDC